MQLPLPAAEFELVAPRFRLSLVREAAPSAELVSFNRPEVVARYLFDQLHVDASPQERMLAFFLDTRNQLIGHIVAFVGTLNRAVCEPRPILQVALLVNAAGVVLSHNHPSGDPSPSVEDLAFSRRLSEAGEIVGPRLIDHIITGEAGSWVSLRQRGGW